MKKVLIGFCLAIFFTTSLPTTHAAEIQIKVDGITIISDAKPETKNNRTMVPLRVISENLGASVEWSKSGVVLAKDDIKVTLTVNSDTAERNGEKIRLDAKPYMKNNRIFVPLRFIAETFDCDVNYSDRTVSVDTKPLIVNGTQVVALQHEYHMTMGGVVQQVHRNVYNRAIYDIFMKNKGEKVDAPAMFSWRFHVDNPPGSYNKDAQYDFLDQKGNSLVRFDVYYLNSSNASEHVEGYPEVLVHDVSRNEWYLFSQTANASIIQLILDAAANGFLTIISNTVA